MNTSHPLCGLCFKFLCAVLPLGALPAATIVVNSSADPAGFDPGVTVATLGPTVTLRDAVNAAQNTSGSHVITFDPSLAGATIELSQVGFVSGGNNAFYLGNSLAPDKTITFQGPTGGAGVTIARAAGAPDMRLFFIDTNFLVVNFNDLSLTGGRASNGGAVFLRDARLNFNRCVLYGNEALGGGGGAIFKTGQGSWLTMTNCTVTDNHTRSIEVNGETFTDHGGGIHQEEGGSEYYHVTISGNTVGGTATGGGVFFRNTGVPPTLRNCIIAGNSTTGPFGIPDLSGAANKTTSTHNLIGTQGGALSSELLVDGTNGNRIGVDAYLAPLASNGGPTPTMRFNGPSPAIDNGTVLTGIDTDQRGIARPQGSAPDIGAFEAAPRAPVLISPASTTFTSTRPGSFLFEAIAAPFPAYSFTGTLPPGVTLGGDGLLSGTPAVLTEGSYPITVTADNGIAPAAVQNFTLVVQKGDLLVTTTVDEDDGGTDPGLGTGTSLREAVNFANAQATPQTITFDPALAGQTIELSTVSNATNGGSALDITGEMVILGLTGPDGITISRAAGAPGMRLFNVSNAGMSPGVLTLEDLTLANGSSNFGGAVFNSGSFVARRCTFMENHSSNKGGAFYNVGGNATFINCTIAYNTSLFGSSAGHSDPLSGSLTMINSTVVNNRTTSAVEVVGQETAGLGGSGTLTNCIVALNNQYRNSSPSPAFANVDAGFAGTYNLIGFGGTGGFTDGVDGNIVGDFNIGLAILSQVENPEWFYFPKVRVVSGDSPTPYVPVLKTGLALNAGTTVPQASTDQRGVARPQGGTPEIGAYEYLPSYVVTTTVDENDLSSDPALGTGTSLREALLDAADSGVAQTLTFAPALAGQTVTLNTGWNDGADTSALRITTEVLVRGPSSAPGIALKVADGVDKRHFYVEGSGNLTLENLTLRDGTGDNGGAVWNFGSLTARGCTFTANHATGEGGAIQSWGNSPLLWLENSTFAGNSSDGNGSAIVTGATAATLRHVTITGNTGPGVALSIWTHEVDATNTLIAGNSVEGVGSAEGGSFSAASANNLLSTGSGAGLTHGVSGNLVGIPAPGLYLGPLGDNGGPTPTVALLSGSPAINTGTTIGGLTLDQRGAARVVGGLPDIGAMEEAAGDTDPDRDNLNNVTEAFAGTSPVLIDTDADGFNDATENLSGSDPTLDSSVPGSTRIERVLGFGPARGLDLSGTFVHAFNVGTPGSAGQAGDAFFSADNAAGVTVSAPYEIANWTTRDFGASQADTTLETVFQSIRWADLGNLNPNLRTITVTLGNLTPGAQYSIQLLFAENSDAIRRFDVSVDGVLVADDFCPAEAQGIPFQSYSAAAVVHQFVAGGTSAQVVLSGNDISIPAGDSNPILNGVTLEQTRLAPLAQWRELHGLAANGADDQGNPSGDGVVNILKYAFNLAPNAGDLQNENTTVLPPDGTAGIPAITVNSTPTLVFRFVRRKASTFPGITYVVETNDDLTNVAGWTALDLSGATVESIDADWERVTVTDPGGGSHRFGRVGVQ